MKTRCCIEGSHSLRSKRFCAVQEQITRNKSQRPREKWRHAVKTENPVPRSFFVPKLNRNACYAGQGNQEGSTKIKKIKKCYSEEKLVAGLSQEFKGIKNAFRWLLESTMISKFRVQIKINSMALLFRLIIVQRTRQNLEQQLFTNKNTYKIT